MNASTAPGERATGIPRACIRQGLIAGLLGGTALIVFFFIYDLVQGEPLRTPTYLASALLVRGGVEPGVIHLVGYTLLHFLVFALLGAVASVLFEWAAVPRNLLVGAAFGLFTCSLIFYPALIITGSDVLQAPAWPAVLAGNVLAGIVIVGYLRWASGAPGVTGLRAPAQARKILREGAIAGLIGASAVALWFLVADALARQPFFTPGALGSILFLGAQGPGDVVISAGTVIGYTLVHFAAFILVGTVMSGIVTQIERFPPLIFGLLLLLVVFQTFIVVMVAMLGGWMADAVEWWVMLLGNVFASITMGGYLWRAHPVLREELTSDALWTR